MVDFQDEKEVKSWLADQSPRCRSAIVARMACRVLPFHRSAHDDGRDLLALATCRACLTACLAVVLPGRHNLDAARRAGDPANKSKIQYLAFKWPPDADHADASWRAALSAAAAASAEDNFNAASKASEYATDRHFTEYSGHIKASTDALATDAEALAAGTSPDDLLRLPLWHTQKSPHKGSSWGADPETWGFWRRWYDGMLAGQPLPWELQEQVALIPNDIWEAGPEAVAREIETIEARFELEARIAELERDIAALKVDRHGIGGNMPPEPIEEPLLAAEMRRLGAQLEPVEEALVVLKEEAARDEPDKARLSSAVATIAAALTAILRWTGSKLDLAIDTLIKWGIPTGCAYLLANPQRLQAVLDAAKRLLNLL